MFAVTWGVSVPRGSVTAEMSYLPIAAGVPFGWTIPSKRAEKAAADVRASARADANGRAPSELMTAGDRRRPGGRTALESLGAALRCSGACVAGLHADARRHVR